MAEILNGFKATVAWAAGQHIETITRDVSPSTNSEAKSLLFELGARALVIANHQTSGRGRGDHTWSDAPGQALLSSWIFRVTKSPQPVMSALLGLALFDAASSTWPSIKFALRAPNDLHVVEADGTTSKLAGILIELTNSAVAQVSVIVGLGLNVTSAPTGTKPYKATSLSQQLLPRGQHVTTGDWSKFLSKWLGNCEASVTEGLDPELSSSARVSIQNALLQHPEYRELREVEPDGSIVFNDGRKVSWTQL